MKFFKIVLLGEEETGKSQILNRFVKDEFTDAYKPTIGAEFLSKNADDGNSSLQLWNSGGGANERFSAVSDTFLQGSHAIILVASYDKEKSLPALKGFAKLAKESCPNAKVLVVINKADLDPSQRKFSEGDVTSVIKTELSDICGNLLKEKQPISTSAKSDAEANGSNFTSISKVFGDLAETLVTLGTEKDEAKTRSFFGFKF